MENVSSSSSSWISKTVPPQLFDHNGLITVKSSNKKHHQKKKKQADKPKKTLPLLSSSSSSSAATALLSDLHKMPIPINSGKRENKKGDDAPKEDKTAFSSTSSWENTALYEAKSTNPISIRPTLANNGKTKLKKALEYAIQENLESETGRHTFVDLLSPNAENPHIIGQSLESDSVLRLMSKAGKRSKDGNNVTDVPAIPKKRKTQGSDAVEVSKFAKRVSSRKAVKSKKKSKLTKTETELSQTSHHHTPYSFHQFLAETEPKQLDSTLENLHSHSGSDLCNKEELQSPLVVSSSPLDSVPLGQEIFGLYYSKCLGLLESEACRFRMMSLSQANREALYTCLKSLEIRCNGLITKYDDTKKSRKQEANFVDTLVKTKVAGERAFILQLIATEEKCGCLPQSLVTIIDLCLNYEFQPSQWMVDEKTTFYHIGCCLRQWQSLLKRFRQRLDFGYESKKPNLELVVSEEIKKVPTPSLGTQGVGGREPMTSAAFSDVTFNPSSLLNVLPPTKASPTSTDAALDVIDNTSVEPKTKTTSYPATTTNENDAASECPTPKCDYFVEEERSEQTPPATSSFIAEAVATPVSPDIGVSIPAAVTVIPSVTPARPSDSFWRQTCKTILQKLLFR